MSRLSLFLLGPPRVDLDGLPVEFDTRKAVALLAYLAVTGRRESRDHLAALLWPDHDQAHARAALRRTLSTVNTALGSDWLATDRESVALRPTPALWSDVAEFQAALAAHAAHSHTPDEICDACLGRLKEAATLSRGDFMAHFSLRDSPTFEEWQFFQAESHRRELAQLLERLVRGENQRQAYDAAISYARRWVALDPLHEPAHRALMRLYGETGQWAAAVRQYRECVRVLQEELGVTPLEETTQLYEAVKERRIQRQPRETAVEGSVVPAIPPILASSPPAGTLHHLPLIGRQAEWQALVEAYHTMQGDGRLVVLEGEAGVGKTRLAEAFLDYARTQGAITVAAGCYEGQAHLAYAPFADALRAALAARGDTPGVGQHWLSEVARLLPELPALVPGLPPPPPLDNPGAQTRLFEAVHQVLLAACARTGPGVLFLDDLHWADEASVELLTYLVRRSRGRPLFILATWRGEQVPPGRLRSLVAEVRRLGSARLIALSRLSAAAMRELILASGLRVSQATAEQLYQATEGLPFFVVEYLAALAAGERLDNLLPGPVRALLHSRLAVTDAAGQQLLQAAAVIGRSFDFDTLRDASGRSEEETILGLEGLTAHGLVREMHPQGDSSPLMYDFSHERLRHLVYEETSLARRRLLHRRVAETLIGRGRGTRPLGSLAALVAQHYQVAGQEDEAAQYFTLAGDHERALYANRTALAHYRAALALGYPAPARLHEAIGDLHTGLGEYSAALSSYETAVALCSPSDVGAIEHKLAQVYQRRGEWEQAEAHFGAAHDALSAQDAPGQSARLYADWSLTAHRQGEAQRAREFATKALEQAQAAGDASALAQVYNLLGMLALGDNQFDLACQHVEASLALAERLDDPQLRMAALNNLARTAQANGHLERAVALTEAALTLCVSRGDRHREAALHNNLADLFHALGRPNEAIAHLREAVGINAEISQEAGTLQPEIWKLTEW